MKTNRYISIFSLKIFFALCVILSSCRPDPIPSESDSDIGPVVLSSSLSNQKVMAIAEDAAGRVWLGTFRGLNRYSTHGFHQYFCTDDSLDLPDNQISCLFKDSKNRFWVGTIQGVVRLNDRDKFDRVPINQPNACGYQFVEANSGEIYYNLNSSLAKYDEVKDSLKVIIPDLQTPYAIHSNAFTDSNNDLWVANSTCLRRYDKESYQLADSIPLNDYVVCSYFDKASGTLWMGGYKNMRKFDVNSRQFVQTPHAFTSHPLYNIAQATHIYPYTPNQLLINTFENGLFLYDIMADTIIDENSPDFPFNPPHFIITQIFKDSWGNLWFGAYDQGYAVAKSSSRKFNTLKNLNDTFEGKSVISVDCDKNGNLVLVTLLDGVFYYDLETSAITKIILDETGQLPGYQFNNITTAFFDKDDNLWLSSLRANKVINGKLENKSGRFSTLASYDVIAPHTIKQDDRGTIFIGLGIPAVAVITPTGDISITNVNTSGHGFVSSIQPMPDHSIVVGSLMSPINIYNPYTRLFQPTGIDAQAWSACLKRGGYIPTDMFLDSFGDVWIGTVGNGIIKYTPTTGEVTRIEGAPCTDICSFQEDKQHDIWISTQYGLGHIDRKTNKFTNYYANDGIGGNQFFDRASCMLPDGRLVFCGTHGITIFDPGTVSVSKPMKPIFQDLKIHNHLISPAEHHDVIECALWKCPDINLAYDQNSFSISFAVSDNSAEDIVRYQYMLDGHDPHWVNAASVNETYYGNIPSGDYTFRVRIVGNDGKPIDNSEIAINVHVATAPWLSTWAIIGYIFVFLMIVLLIANLRKHYIMEKRRTQQVTLEKEQEKRVNKMNMSFFANISHEFRTPLTMIAAPLSQLNDDPSTSPRQRQLISIAKHSVDRMLRLVNQLLDFNKLENDTLKLQISKIDIVGMLRQITEVFRINAEKKNIRLTIEGLEEHMTVPVDADKIEKIMSNLLSNAVKFTPAGGNIAVKLDVKDNMMEISVADSGPGIPDDQLDKVFERYYQVDNKSGGSYNWGTGIGLYYARALARLHHGSLTAANNPAQGAVFTLCIPYDDVYTAEEHVDATKSTFVIESVTSIRDDEPKPNPDHDTTVLVVDDDPEVVDYLKVLLSSNYNVISCFNADDAFDLAEKAHPDLIISDVVMPDTDGYQLTRRIKEDIQLCHIPVILITAKSLVENQVEGLDSGADAYVTKPFDPKYVLALIKSQLANRDKIKTMLAKSTELETSQDDKDNLSELSPLDRSFMTELYAIMESELSNSELDINHLTKLLRISRTKLYYKVKGLTGTNPGAFFKTYKLNRAAQFIKEGNYTISEIADMTGFSTLSHFSASFKKQFGVSPSDYK